MLIGVIADDFTGASDIAYVTAGGSCAAELLEGGGDWQGFMRAWGARMAELQNEHGFRLVAESETELLLAVR